jgi:hypothetical protein
MRDDIMINGWRKPRESFCNGNCVEVGSAPGAIGVRDTKLEASPVLVFGSEGWGAFLSAVKSGTVAS